MPPEEAATAGTGWQSERVSRFATVVGAPSQAGTTGAPCPMGHLGCRQLRGSDAGQPGIVILLSRFGGWVMIGRLLSVTGTALLIAVGLVTPVLATATATPASAQTVIEGCTIVSNPTPTNFTNCSLMNLFDANFSGLNLSYANFAQSTFAYCTPNGPSCSAADFSGANLTDANLENIEAAAEFYATDPPEGADAEANFGDANLSGANLSYIFLAANLGGANLTGADLTGTSMVATPTDLGIGVGASLTANLAGANFTDTILVPSNQSVTATSKAGAVATWSTPSGLPGATPGSCTPTSGSTFPPFSSTVTCQVFDATGGEATGTFEVTVQPASQVLVPSDGATLSGSTYLDASAPNATSVEFLLFGGTYGFSAPVLCTATPTLYGWLCAWNTTTVPNGSYVLVSEAFNSAGSTFSSGVNIKVENPPTTSVLIPSQGATLSSTAATLDASASNATSVEFRLFGGTYGFSAPVLCTATPTLYGWLCAWNTTTVPNGSYVLVSEAFNSAGSTFSSGVNIKVSN